MNFNISKTVNTTVKNEYRLFVQYSILKMAVCVCNHKFDSSDNADDSILSMSINTK